MATPNQAARQASVFALTTDNTQTTILNYTTRSNHLYTIRVLVHALKTTDFNLAAAYDLEALVKNVGGTLSVVQSTVNSRLGATGEDAGAAAWDCTIDVSSADIRVRATGANSTAITWAVFEPSIFESGAWVANYGQTN